MLKELVTGLDFKQPYHWFYAAMLFLVTPIVAIICIFTFFGPGWFLALFWWWIMGELEPEEMDLARGRMSIPSKEPAKEQPKAEEPERIGLWMRY